MSAPQTLPDNSVVDLRARASEPAAGWSSPVVIGETEPGRSFLRRRRVIAAAVLVMLVGVVGADFVVGRIVHGQHQRHLAAAIQISKEHTVVGDPVMILQIPSIHLNQVVVDGADPAQLRGGPGLVVGGAVPGSRGTSVVLGHRYRYGAPFQDLDRVHVGDRAAVKLRTGVVRTYRVSRVASSPTDDRRPFAPTRAERIVLVTDGPGLWPHRRELVTLTPTVAATSGRAPTQPVVLAAGSSGASLVLVAGLVVAAVAAIGVGAAQLRQRYRLATVSTVLVPVAGLLLVVVVLSLDLALSATY